MELKNILLVVIPLLVIAGTSYYSGKNRSETQWQLKWSQRDKADKTAQAKQEADNRAREQESQHAITEISKDAEKKLQAVSADAVRAADGADRLHGAISELQQRLRNSQSTVDSALTGKRQAEALAGKLLAQLLEQSDERAGEYAAAADDARVRGLACEQAYDAILNQK